MSIAANKQNISNLETREKYNIDIDNFTIAKEERAMWRAIIVQALMDASSNSKKAENLQWKNDALIWLRGTSKDFKIVCYHADYDPQHIRKMVKQALARDCVWRAAPGMGELSKTGKRKKSNKKATNLR